MRRGPAAVFDLRQKSLVRGTVLVLVSFLLAVWISHFPENRPTFLLAIPAVLALLGTADTVRCMQRRWNFYHGGVVLLIYMDLMVLATILFLLLYPYASWLSSSR